MTAYERFKALRKKTMAAIHTEIDEDPYCKSYEGSFEIVACYPKSLAPAAIMNGLVKHWMRLWTKRKQI